MQPQPPHSRQLKSKREYLAQATEKTQPRISDPAPGICLPFHSEAVTVDTSTSSLAATVPREIKHTHCQESLSPDPEKVGSVPPGLRDMRVGRAGPQEEMSPATREELGDAR